MHFELDDKPIQTHLHNATHQILFAWPISFLRIQLNMHRYFIEMRGSRTIIISNFSLLFRDKNVCFYFFIFCCKFRANENYSRCCINLIFLSLYHFNAEWRRALGVSVLVAYKNLCDKYFLFANNFCLFMLQESESTVISKV